MIKNENKMTEQIEDWDLRIEPQSKLIDLKLRDVWHYRDLLFLLVRRDFVSVYKQTILGPLWFFIQPILTTITFTFFFGKMANLSTDALPKPLFYMAGVTAWNYFSDCLTKTSNTFVANASIFGKVYFPRLIIPISIVISNLIRFGIQMLMFFIVMGFYIFKGAAVHANAYVLLFPLLVVLMALLGLGFGMIASALTTKYRDLTFLLTFGVTLLMYATPVIIPLSSISAKYKWVMLANPMSSIIETFRYAFLGSGSFSWAQLGYSSVFTVVILFLGMLIFNQVERSFIDTV
jgi:lipopolysaccharide transport system permease protein